MKDIPYNVLKQYERAYEIMLLRDQRELTYAAIAKAITKKRAAFHFETIPPFFV